MPVSAGRFFSSLVKASRPPVEAPTPTTGKVCPAAPVNLSPGSRSADWGRELDLLGMVRVRLVYWMVGRTLLRYRENNKNSWWVGVG